MLSHSVKTALLLVVLSALFLLIGYAIGGEAGIYGAFLMSIVMNVGAYWFSDKIVLAVHRAQEINESNRVYHIVKELSRKANLPMPKVYSVPEWTPNAFATGRNPEHSAVAVTQGLLKILTEDELRAVLAHELSHIKNRDTLVSTVAATIASAVMYLAHMAQWIGFMGSARDDEKGRGLNPLALILTIVLAPIATMLIQFAVSRTREFMADESGAGLCQKPMDLASALEKISNPARLKQFQNQDILPDMQPAFSHLYIVNHFSTESALSWFSTHPPVEERVKRLKDLQSSPPPAATDLRKGD